MTRRQAELYMNAHEILLAPQQICARQQKKAAIYKMVHSQMRPWSHVYNKAQPATFWITL